MTHTLLADAAPQATNLWPIIATVASLFASGMFGLVLYNLQTLKASFAAGMDSIKERQESQAKDIRTLFERKNTCNQDFVGKVEYIRSSNGLEEGMKELIKQVATLNGTMKVIEQMPSICGQIARDIVKEMNNG